MNLDTFHYNFSHVASAPEGVKSIRQLVMASALAGKFSLPNEELPPDIQSRLEEARMVYFRASGKREKPLVFGDPLIQEFDIPIGWKWVRVGQICDLQTGATPSTQRPEYWGGEIPWLASGDVNRQEIFECEGRITDDGLANSNCKILPKNSVLIALNGQGKTRATVALLRMPAACNQSLVAMIPFDAKIVTPEYLFLALRYRYYEIRDVTGQDQRRGLNMGLVSDLSVPLAPLSEQKRIVVKVDELMALCDKLESQQQERKRLFPILSLACHARFAEEPTPTNLNRIFEETGTVSPADLRRTILSLAIKGKLVPQKPNDGLASQEYVEILARKAEWISNGKVRKQPTLNRLSEAEHPWELPETWFWCRLGEVTTYGSTEKADLQDTTPETWVLELEDIEKDTSRLLTKVRAQERRFQSSKNRFSRGDVLYGKLRPYLDKVVLADEDGVCTTEIIPITIYSGILPEYLRWFLKSPFFKSYANGSTHGMNLPRMGTEAGRNAVFPLPPLAEQKRIVAKVHELMTLVDQLETQQMERDKLAEAFARACVASFTVNAQLERPEKMKTPKTELISLVTLGKKPEPDAKAPLAHLLIQSMGTIPSKSLWQLSGLTIDAFYQQLKTEIAQGWIAPPAEAEMKILEEA